MGPYNPTTYGPGTPSGLWGLLQGEKRRGPQCPVPSPGALKTWALIEGLWMVKKSREGGEGNEGSPFSLLSIVTVLSTHVSAKDRKGGRVENLRTTGI